MNERYKLPASIRRFERDRKVVLINPEIPSWIVTNKIGELILSLFDGENSTAEVIDAAVEGLGEHYRKRIEEFCSYVINSRLFETLECKDQRHPYLLQMVHLSISDSCNLKCTYCYAAERKELGSNNLSIEEYKRVIDGIRQINPNCSFTITGGEPLMNPLWKDIAEYIKGLGNECWLLSNGTLFNESNIVDIKRLFDRVTVSIDGSRAEVHSLTRGKNYDKVLRAIKLMDENGINYSLSMTVTRNNISDVANMAEKYGNRLNFAPLFPVSDFANKELAITGLEYFQALKSAAGVNPLSYCESSLDSSQCSRCHKCAIGDGEISVSASGDVYPCQLLHSKEFYAGNVRETSITDIYTHSPALKKCSQLDVDKIEGCKDCAFRYICGGACRARAFYEVADVNSSGDFCVYEKEAFLDGIVNIYNSNILHE